MGVSHTTENAGLPDPSATDRDAPASPLRPSQTKGKGAARKRKPFTLRERRRMCQTFDNRPRTNWGCGDLPAPWCEGDVVELVGEPHKRLKGQVGPMFVVTYATSVGGGDDWYFRVNDGSRDWGSDRLHVFNGGEDDTNWMAPFRLVETRDLEGLALREQMLADGWTYTPPPRCETCGQRLPRFEATA